MINRWLVLLLLWLGGASGCLLSSKHNPIEAPDPIPNPRPPVASWEVNETNAWEKAAELKAEMEDEARSREQAITHNKK